MASTCQSFFAATAAMKLVIEFPNVLAGLLLCCYAHFIDPISVETRKGRTTANTESRAELFRYFLIAPYFVIKDCAMPVKYACESFSRCAMKFLQLNFMLWEKTANMQRPRVTAQLSSNLMLYAVVMNMLLHWKTPTLAQIARQLIGSQRREREKSIKSSLPVATATYYHCCNNWSRFCWFEARRLYVIFIKISEQWAVVVFANVVHNPKLYHKIFMHMQHVTSTIVMSLLINRNGTSAII